MTRSNGERGDDLITGRRGDDYIDAGAGSDELIDWLGANVLHGGSGNDSGLGDYGLLGSSVENQRIAILRGGAITTYEIYEVNGSIGYGTRFVREGGRLYLEYFGATGSGSNRVSARIAASCRMGRGN